MKRPIEEVLKEIMAVSRRALGEKLTGVYLHGSLAMGCFNPEKSDIDFLIVVGGKLTEQEKRAVMDGLLALCPDVPKKGMEMSVVLDAYCRSFVYPTPYELHFANHALWLYREQPKLYLEKYQGTDPDLAAHFTITKYRGKTLYGEPIPQLFGDIPKEAYWDSIRLDILHPEEQAEENPLYIILNLCRVAACREEEKILSKAEGGIWGIEHTEERFRPMLEDALAAYRTEQTAFQPDMETAKSFCRYMLRRLEIDS